MGEIWADFVPCVDDISLGPPKTVFASSRHGSRLADEPASTDDAENPRAKFFSDRVNRRSGMQEKDGRDKLDSWTLAAERRAQGGGDDDGKGDKNDRYGRHDANRNGFGEKGDPRWNSNRGDERRQNGDRPTGGWREREQARRHNGDRHDEREPEWMDESDPVVKRDQELNFSKPSTAEEFQKWKESMSRKTKGEPEVEKEKEATVEAAPPPPGPKPSLTLDGFEPGGFFAFNAPSGTPTPGGSTATPPASAIPAKTAGKGKTSRFASMFKPPVEETPPPPPPESDVQKIANGFARTTAEDQEGFNRVLQMLGGGLKIGGPPTPASESPAPAPAPALAPAPSAPQSPLQPTRAGANGTGAKPKSRFFQSQPKSPERMQSPQQGGIQLGGDNHFDREEPAARPPQEPTRTPEPNNMYNVLREQQPRPASGRVNELAMFDPPRSAPSPDINIQNLLAQQRQRPQHHSNESQNLLNLLKKSDVSQQASRPPSQQTGGVNPADLQRWLDHQHQANSHGGAGHNVETYAPKPARLPQQPPGLYEEQLMRNCPSREDLGREPQQMPPGIPEPRRQPPQQQRAPPGFYDEREMMMQQQQQMLQQQQQQQQMRRNYGDPQPQHQQMPPQPQPFRKPQGPQPQYQGEYHITSPNLSGPPPGFGAAPPPHHMPRQPPGFGGQPHPQHFQQQREPPPPGSMPPGFGPQNGGGPPPGFYGAGPPPPGFQNVRGSMDGSGMPPPPPGMRSRPSAQYDGYENGRRG